jgi:hypothetical protein
VTGEPLSASTEKTLRVNTGKNVRVQTDSQGGQRIVLRGGKRRGDLFAREKVPRLQTELKIDGDVDFNTGNITFPGNIYVTGADQRAGSASRPAGSSSWQVHRQRQGGMRRRSVGQRGRGGQSVVKAGGQAQVSFVENSTIEAEKAMCVRQDSVVDSLCRPTAVCHERDSGRTVRSVHKMLGRESGSPRCSHHRADPRADKELKERRAKMAEEAAFC